MAKAKSNGDQPQIIPGLEGLPEIPALGADDAGGVREDTGGQESGQGGAGEAEQSAPSGEGKSPVEMVLAEHEHSLVGGRHLAMIDGLHTWLTNIENGVHVLTFDGQKLLQKILDRE